MMNRFLLFLFLFLLSSNLLNGQNAYKINQDVQNLFNKRCVNCHGQDSPDGDLSLVSDGSFYSTVNIPAKQNPALKRIDPGKPEQSYLFRKIAQNRELYPFLQSSMPLYDDPLSKDEIDLIRNWIISLPADNTVGNAVQQSGGKEIMINNAGFFASQLAHLPTTQTLGQRTAEFRILHRFAIMNGGGNRTLQSFFGLDNGSNISINLSVALAKNLDLLVRRTGTQKNVEFAVKYIPFQFNALKPAVVGFYAGIDWISRSDVDASHRVSPNVQILMSSQIHHKFSVLLAPSFSFLTNHQSVIRRSDGRLYKDTRYTFALGLGAEYHVKPGSAFIAEWIPVIDGYQGNSFANDRRYNTWSAGYSYRIGLHTFALMVTNNPLLHTSQYLPGTSSLQSGKLFNDGPNFHFGFNIFRTFKW